MVMMPAIYVVMVHPSMIVMMMIVKDIIMRIHVVIVREQGITNMVHTVKVHYKRGIASWWIIVTGL